MEFFWPPFTPRKRGRWKENLFFFWGRGFVERREKKNEMKGKREEKEREKMGYLKALVVCELY
jgi:hypothetical protein